MPISPAMIPACASSIQLRRLPSSAVRSGSGRRSITGAQSTLIEKVMPTQEKKPTVVRLTSASRSQSDRVEKISRNGSPAEKPRNSMPMTRGCR